MNRYFFAGLLALNFPVLTLSGQQVVDVSSDSVQVLETLIVTATRNPQKLVDVASPTSVITRQDLVRRPVGSAISIFTQLPGLDVTGVGPNQLRPVIRGLSGQRVLLLEDGLRVNNTRRQQDFGELPALIQQDALDRVEIIRGSSSVLYGSDAIGGVINMIGTSLPGRQYGNTVHGTARFRYVGGTSGIAQPSGTLTGRKGRVAFRVDGDFRDAGRYTAPAGKFGALRLASPTTVEGSGVTDRNVKGQIGVGLSKGSQVFLKYNDYKADDAGFGHLDPSIMGQFATEVDIRYPEQRVRRTTIGYHGTELNLPLAQRLDIAAFGSSNKRHFDQDIFAPFGPGTPPNAGVAIATRNYTDVQTVGARIEAVKPLGKRQVITWGAEISRDRADGTDSSSTTVMGFGPPDPEISNRPALPKAQFRALGIFVQNQLSLTGKLTAIIGGRFQSNKAETFATDGLDDEPAGSSDQTGVWAANFLYRVSDDVRLIFGASRGFRSPNLVERFFQGVTPEGSAFQSRNTTLSAETSLDLDLGLRLRQPSWSFDGFVFQNRLKNGIRISATGDTVMNFPEYQNTNVDQLRIRGVELTAQWQPVAGAVVSANFTSISQEDSEEPLEPVGNEYSSKMVLGARYKFASGRLWAGLRVRSQGERPSAIGEASVVGSMIPGFTVLDLDLGLIPLEVGGTFHVLTATVENVTNSLYAEAANAGFFRPAPGRRVQLMWRTEF